MVLERDGAYNLDRRVRIGEVLHTVKEDRNILRATKRRKTKWIGHICLLKHVTEGKIEGRTEVKESRGRRRKQLLKDLNEKGDIGN